jgi:hypothetical protein
MTALTRRHVLAGAAAAVAAAALPAAAVADVANGEVMLEAPASGVLLAGSRELVDATARIGDWYWDFESRDVLQLTENGWKFLFNLADSARTPSDAEVEDLVPHIAAAEVRRSYTMAEIEAVPRWEFS